MTSDATPKPSYRRVVAALAESEDRYRVLVESVRQYAIFMLDPMGIVITWNRGIYELLGYYREEIVGQSGAMLFNVADRAAGVFAKELARAERSGVWNGFEYVGSIPIGTLPPAGRPVTPDNIIYLTSVKDGANYTVTSKVYYRSG